MTYLLASYSSLIMSFHSKNRMGIVFLDPAMVTTVEKAHRCSYRDSKNVKL